MLTTLRTTLKALETQLATQKATYSEYYNSVFLKQVNDLNDIVSGTLSVMGIDNYTVNFSNSYCTIFLRNLESNMYTNSNKIELYYNLPWRTKIKEIISGAEEKPIDVLELSFFGSRCNASDIATRNYLHTLGKVAESLRTIELKYFDWYIEYTAYETALRLIDGESDLTANAIYKIQNEIRELELAEYKTQGFKCEIKSSKKTRYTEDSSQELCDEQHSILLYFGRSKWDRVHVIAFEITEIKKNKVTLNYTHASGDSSNTITVTMKYFEEFIAQVYRWQTEGADESTQESIKRFEKYQERQKAA